MKDKCHSGVEIMYDRSITASSTSVLEIGLPDIQGWGMNDRCITKINFISGHDQIGGTSFHAYKRKHD